MVYTLTCVFTMLFVCVCSCMCVFCAQYAQFDLWLLGLLFVDASTEITRIRGIPIETYNLPIRTDVTIEEK
jgi:hypothetical protein